MDTRFPKWLRLVVGKLDFVGIPNLAPLICAMMVLVFLGKTMGSTPLEHFVFDPEKILAGEWWRLFAFPVAGNVDNPMFLIFEVMWTYFMVNSLEQQWGPTPLTLFLFIGYVMGIAVSFITMQPVPIWFYLLFNVTFACGTLFPDFEFLLFFVLPVKMKWMAMLMGAWFAFKFIAGALDTKLILLFTFSPYILFFSPLLYDNIRAYQKLRKHKSKFDNDMWR